MGKLSLEARSQLQPGTLSLYSLFPLWASRTEYLRGDPDCITCCFLPAPTPHTDEQDLLLVHHPNMPENPRVLRVVILGAPNAGKSTLSNQLLGRKVCCIFDIPSYPAPFICHFFLFLYELSHSDLGTQLGLTCFWQVFPVSKKVHTTRCQALGVITEKEAQVVGTFKGSPANWTGGELKRVSLTVRPEQSI